MGHPLRIALVGDYNPAVVAHQAIPEALRLAALQQSTSVEPVWFHTSTIVDPHTQFASCDGIWCVPASPYANTEAALATIRYAREHGRLFLSTCGGFQHAIMEYARNVCGLTETEHAETNPNAERPLISHLACSLVEQSEEIILNDEGHLRTAYACPRIVEGYHCNYGLNRDYAPLLFRNGLHATAHDATGEVRAIELASHPFFVATLFQPERRALKGEAPPLVTRFLAMMAAGLAN